MRFYIPTTAWRNLTRVVLLGALLLLGSGCAALSRATVGISGTNDSERPTGP
jgi:hypothetical protein